MTAAFKVILKDGKPWLEWSQYEITYLKIWKANSNKPYCKYHGLTIYLEDYLINQLKSLK